MTDGIALLCSALRDAGVDCVFGIPGTQTTNLFEGLRQARIRTVLASHELGAAFMANGYYRASGRLAAVAVIPGPGFTNTLTGIAEARLDSAGLLLLVPKPASHPGRAFQLQAIDQAAIAAPLVKSRLALGAASEAAALVHEACSLALGGGPGPVMIEIDLDALSRDRAAPRAAREVERADPSREALAQLASWFARAERPVVLAGQGAFGISDRIRELAEAFTIPVVATPSARGIVPDDHALALGFDPLRSSVSVVNALFDRADLVVALGCRLGHNGSAGFELAIPPDRFVHVDADAAVLDANYPAALAIAAPVEAVGPALAARHQRTAWTIDELAAMRTQLRAVPAGRAEPEIHGAPAATAAEFFGWLRRTLPRDAMLVTDSGLHQILARRHFDVLAPRGLVAPTDFQSMGFGVPAAIGAKLAAPERDVVALVGDGGFLMSGLELLTARRENIPISVIVFNDGQLNQIRLQQVASYGHTHAVDVLDPDFEMLAASLGVAYCRFGDTPAAEVERALRARAPALIEVEVGDSTAMRVRAAAGRMKAAARSARDSSLGAWLMRALGSAKHRAS